MSRHHTPHTGCSVPNDGPEELCKWASLPCVLLCELLSGTAIHDPLHSGLACRGSSVPFCSVLRCLPHHRAAECAVEHDAQHQPVGFNGSAPAHAVPDMPLVVVWHAAQRNANHAAVPRRVVFWTRHRHWIEAPSARSRRAVPVPSCDEEEARTHPCTNGPFRRGGPFVSRCSLIRARPGRAEPGQVLFASHHIASSGVSADVVSSTARLLRKTRQTASGLGFPAGNQPPPPPPPRVDRKRDGTPRTGGQRNTTQRNARDCTRCGRSAPCAATRFLHRACDSLVRCESPSRPLYQRYQHHHHHQQQQQQDPPHPRLGNSYRINKQIASQECRASSASANRIATVSSVLRIRGRRISEHPLYQHQ